jgi:PAS domain-containing protein
MNNQLYISITLDEKGYILDFESIIEGLKYDKSEVIGKNWFDMFIEPIDQSEVLKLFRDNFYSDDLLNKSLWQHITDIKTKDGHHKLIDFENTILVYDNGKKALYSKGIEHFTHINILNER